jgi:ribosomal protein S18 acetylase RimI-like enzyme
MAELKNFKINLTTDPQKIAACATMMSQTDPWITLVLDYAQCLKAFDGPCKEIYILEKGNEPAGFAILQICGTFKGYIQTLCIKEGYRGKGLGHKVLLFCEERIFKISPNIFICVSDFNVGAIKLYNTCGFKLVGRLDHFVKDGFTELLLRKTIGPIAGYPISGDL